MIFDKIFKKEERIKHYKIWKKIAKKSDYVIKPYRQEFCYIKNLKPACMELIAMEYGGINVKSFIINNKKQTPRWWINLTEQIIEILNLFKKLKFTHGDFKLDNILLVDTKHPLIKIIDFTFASYKYDKNKLYDIKRIIPPFINKYPENKSNNKFYKKVPKPIRDFWLEYAKKHNVDTKQVRFK